MTTGNMFLTQYHRALDEQAKKSEKGVEEKVSAPEKDEKPKTVKRKPKK